MTMCFIALRPYVNYFIGKVLVRSVRRIHVYWMIDKAQDILKVGGKGEEGGRWKEEEEEEEGEEEEG